MAESHERTARIYRNLAANPRQSARYNNEQAALFARSAGFEREEATRAAQRGITFRNAARYPWLAIPEAEADTLGSGIGDRDELPGK